MALKYCPECGNKLPEKAKFCPDCGYKLEIPDETPITPEPEIIEEPEITQSRPPINMVEVSDIKSPKKTVVWVIFGVVCCALLVIVILSNGKKESTPPTETVEESIEVTTTAAVVETTIVPETTAVEKVELKLVPAEIGKVTYVIPEEFNILDQTNTDAIYFSDNTIFLIGFSIETGIGNVSKDKIINRLDETLENSVITMIDKLVPGAGIQNNHGITDHSSGEYMRMSSNMTMRRDDELFQVQSEVVCRTGYDDVVVAILITTPTDDSYLAVENQIMNSIRIGEPTELSSTPSSGVSTEVKEFVDGFESFFNKYVDVMKSIGNGSSDLSVLGEYATLLSEYADWMNKIEEFESKDMTAEDSKYFWDAYARVMNNLTSAGLSDN